MKGGGDLMAAAVNGIGLSRRRRRITALRDSPEEEGKMEVRSRERERVQKVDRFRDRDQDQELMSQRKRIRIKERDVDEDYGEPKSSMSNHGLLRRTVTSTRNFKSISDLRLADEMICAEVPRRARSDSVKRLNEHWTSPSSSSFGKKMDEIEIEIEVVEALFDLMKQSHSSKKDERISNLIGDRDVHNKSEAEEPSEGINLEKGKELSEPAQESIGGDQVVVVKEEESRSCAKSYTDGSKFEIDLMAPPPAPSSPERNGSNILMPENVSTCSYTNLLQRQQNHCIVSESERQNFGQSNSLLSPVLATCWPGCFPHPGGDIFPLDKSSRTTALQPAPFAPSEPRTKRCMTHQYIARNIRHHQQLIRKNILPATTGPATLQHQYRTHFLESHCWGTYQKAILWQFLRFQVEKVKIFEVANIMDATDGKQLVTQQTSEQATSGNLSHRAANAAAQQPRLDNSATVIGKASFPAGNPGVSFNYSNLPTNDAPPFMAILHSNTHPYSISTNSGMPLPTKGTQSSVLPFFSASYYPSIYCMPQHQQNQLASLLQSNCLYQVQQASQTTGTSGGSTSSHEQSTSAGSQAQKASNDKNYGISFQAMNFPLVSHGDGKQQQPGSQCRVVVIPPQAVGYSPNPTASIKPGGQFSTMSQETAAFQMLSGVGQLAYQFVPSAQVAQHKKIQVAERKCVVHSDGTDDRKRLSW